MTLVPWARRTVVRPHRERRAPGRSSIVYYKGTERTDVAQNSEFQYLSTIHVYVRMWVPIGKDEFVSPQGYRMKASHATPGVRPPFGV